MAERFAGLVDLGFFRLLWVEPGALDTTERAVVVGDGGDEGGKMLGVAVEVQQVVVEAERAEVGGGDLARVEIVLGVGAWEGVALGPEVAGGLDAGRHLVVMPRYAWGWGGG